MTLFSDVLGSIGRQFSEFRKQRIDALQMTQFRQKCPTEELDASTVAMYTCCLTVSL